jgi:hypothetical protein
MTTLTLNRVIIIALITCAILSLLPDRIHNPLLNRNVIYSYSSSIQDKQKIDQPMRARIEQAYGKLPMRFEANEGQADARVKFMARGAGYTVFLTGDEAVMQLHKQELKSEGTSERRTAETPVESVALRMKLADTISSSRVSGIGKLSSTSNYFIGNDPAAWHKGISHYSKVKIRIGLSGHRSGLVR